MTRQLDPTILRFFTVSRIISPALEMCLCKFHIKIEYFCDDGTHRARRRCLRFGSSPGTIQSPIKTPLSPTFPHRHPLHQTSIFKSQLFTVSHICVRIFCDSKTPPKRRQKPAYFHTFLTPFWFVYFTTERWCPNTNPRHRFPLFPILFFLFTYTSMFCPIFKVYSKCIHS